MILLATGNSILNGMLRGLAGNQRAPERGFAQLSTQPGNITWWAEYKAANMGGIQSCELHLTGSHGWIITDSMPFVNNIIPWFLRLIRCLVPAPKQGHPPGNCPADALVCLACHAPPAGPGRPGGGGASPLSRGHPDVRAGAAGCCLNRLPSP